MRRIVLPIAVCLILLIGCGAPVVVQPELEVVLPTEEPTEPILVWEPVVVEPTTEEPVVEEPVTVEELYVPEEIKRPYEPWQPLPPPPTPGAHPYWRDAPTLEEEVSGPWVHYPEFGSGTRFCFYEPHAAPHILEAEWEELVGKKELVEKGLWEKYIHEDLFEPSLDEFWAEHTGILKEQFVYECRRQSCADLPNPTYAEVLAFMDEAEIGKLDGRLLSGYNGHNGCTLVSIEVKKRANERGIRCANLDVWGRNHVLNAFETTDRGMVWFDTDREQVPITNRTDFWPHWVGVSDYPIKHTLTHVIYIW